VIIRAAPASPGLLAIETSGILFHQHRNHFSEFLPANGFRLHSLRVQPTCGKDTTSKCKREERQANMLSRLKRQPCFRLRLCLLAASGILIILLQSACFSKKAGIAIAPTATMRIAYLPFNVSEDKADFRWTAMAAPVLMKKASSKSREFEIIPLWESMPVAIQAAGQNRNLTPEAVESASTWLTARWTAIGEFTPTQNGVTMMIDFIPGKSNLIPFRYLRSGKIDWIESGAQEAIVQFRRYLMIPQLEPERGGSQDMLSLRNLAEVLDREYGWFVEAEPGKAQETVAALLKTDESLARFLFSPTLYPILAPTK
jgi:hypothetical protein